MQLHPLTEASSLQFLSAIMIATMCIQASRNGQPFRSPAGTVKCAALQTCGSPRVPRAKGKYPEECTKVYGIDSITKYGRISEHELLITSS